MDRLIDFNCMSRLILYLQVRESCLMYIYSSYFYAFVSLDIAFYKKGEMNK